MNNDELKEKIKNLKKDQECTVNWFDGGGGLIRREGSLLNLYEVPQYGGMKIFYDSFKDSEIDEIIKICETWT